MYFLNIVLQIINVSKNVQPQLLHKILPLEIPGGHPLSQFREKVTAWKGDLELGGQTIASNMVRSLQPLHWASFSFLSVVLPSSPRGRESGNVYLNSMKYMCTLEDRLIETHLQEYLGRRELYNVASIMMCMEWGVHEHLWVCVWMCAVCVRVWCVWCVWVCVVCMSICKCVCMSVCMCGVHEHVCVIFCSKVQNLLQKTFQKFCSLGHGRYSRLNNVPSQRCPPLYSQNL